MLMSIRAIILPI